MAISGHKTDSVFKRYDIVYEVDITEAGGKLSQYLHNRKKLREEMVKKQLKLASETHNGFSDEGWNSLIYLVFIGAGDGIWTRDNQLGKLGLYRWATPAS